MEDSQLLKSYRKTHNKEFLGSLYQKYIHLVFGACLKYLKNTQDAEDAVIDIFEKITKKVLSSEIKNFKAWLYVVTKNHCFEQLRKKNVRFHKEKEAKLMYTTQIFHPDTVEKENEVKKLHECLSKIDHLQKACIDLFYFKKMPYQEIADTLSIGYGQVRSKIQNGRRNLKKCMGVSLPNTY